jgi:hypothetical protein
LRRLLFALALLAAWPTVARADDITLRGNYYRDRNTRVVQPEADLTKTFSTGTVIGAHYLLDTITSASVAAGVLRDQPFTELRNEAGFSLGQHVGPALLSASYTYSSESDYWAHTAAISGTVDLFHHNTTLGLALAWGHDQVAQRMGPTNYAPLGGLDSVHLIAGVTQLLSPTALVNLSYDLDVVGFGNKTNGYQGNPYRTVNLGGSPSRESVPFQRFRQSVAVSGNVMVPLGSKLVPYIAFRPSYRFYWDDWSIYSQTPELRIFIPVGPVELRVTGRYYTQTAASFWSNVPGDDTPTYTVDAFHNLNDPQGKACTACYSSSANKQLFYTADPKLSAFDTMYTEIQLRIRLRGLERLSRWLSEGLVEISYGHLFNDAYAHQAFGDAELAGLTLIFPL